MCEVCPSCESKNVSIIMCDHEFSWGEKEIKVHIPIIHCDDCEEEFADYRAFDIMEKAIEDSK